MEVKETRDLYNMVMEVKETRDLYNTVMEVKETRDLYNTVMEVKLKYINTVKPVYTEPPWYQCLCSE